MNLQSKLLLIYVYIYIEKYEFLYVVFFIIYSSHTYIYIEGFSYEVSLVDSNNIVTITNIIVVT